MGPICLHDHWMFQFQFQLKFNVRSSINCFDELSSNHWLKFYMVHSVVCQSNSQSIWLSFTHFNPHQCNPQKQTLHKAGIIFITTVKSIEVYNTAPLDWQAAQEQQPMATRAAIRTVIERNAIHSVDDDHWAGFKSAKLANSVKQADNVKLIR